MTSKTFARSLAILLFGVVVPLVLMVQAYTGLSALDDHVGGAIAKESPTEVFAKARPNLQGANDFALFSMISAERVNQSVVVNKQIMKIVVMQIGFAVASIGLMFIMLGINDGGGAATMGGAGLSFDFKTGSTGALVFVIGAGMATAGGVLRNDYQTVPIPTFKDGGSVEAQAYADVVSAHEQCAKLGGTAAQECFYKVFDQLKPGAAQ